MYFICLINSIRFSILSNHFFYMCTLFFWDFCFCILDITKVKIGSYSRHVTGHGFVIEFKMAGLLAALLGGVMTVSAVFILLFISIALHYFCIRWTRMATPGNLVILISSRYGNG